MKDNLFTAIFAIVLGTVCAFLLTGARETLKGRQDANRKAERIRNVLAVLGAESGEEVSNDELIRIFEERVQVKEGEGDALTLYRYTDPTTKEVSAIAIPFEGPGLWARIKGYLALEPDMKTIKGVTFYEQEETPGLGGDIAEAPFCNQFIGKQIFDKNGKPGFYVTKPDMAKGINEVDGISGATITCDKVTEMLNKMIEKLANESKP